MADDQYAELSSRIGAAITRIIIGEGAMRVPADPTDPDVVLSDCRDTIRALLAERDALLQRLREIVESVEERDREIKRRARAMKIMSERVKELTARLKQYEPTSPWGGAAPANEKEAE